MCEFRRVDDIMLKIISGVMIVSLIAVLSFGMKVYAFMESGDRFTAQDGKKLEKVLREELVDTHVYERDREYLSERLDKIEKKLDLLLLKEK